jgi:antirestriction protein ArdC
LATYKQWQELGAQVRKGEKSSLVVFWKVTDQHEESEAEEDEESSGRRFFARGNGVFNAAQVDGYTPPALPQISEPERIVHAEAFFDRLGADIRHGGAHAYYRPSADFIQMPPFAAFLASEPRSDHAAYIASWLKVLRQDKRAIFTAAPKAQVAADWLQTKQHGVREAARGAGRLNQTAGTGGNSRAGSQSGKFSALAKTLRR